MKMYNARNKTEWGITVSKIQIGESMINKMQRILESGEPINEGSPKIYQERSDGINPLTNIRTDRMELATNARDADAKGRIAKRDERAKALEELRNPTQEGPEGSKEKV